MAIVRSGTIMTQNKNGNRIVILAGTATSNNQGGDREASIQRASSGRIVVIKNGEMVKSEPRR